MTVSAAVVASSEPDLIVRREGGAVKITVADGRTETHDRVIFACHADEALKLLVDADAQEDIAGRQVELLKELKRSLLQLDVSVGAEG